VRQYDSLASVYAWLVPDALLEPEGAAAAFAGVTDGLAPGARVLDCACGTGQLAVGLALQGFAVTATDASDATLAAMAGVLAAGGRLALTSRNWELVRAGGSRLEVADRLVRRGDVDGLVIHAWTIADAWDAPHRLDVAVAFPDPGGRVDNVAEALTFWPFTHEELDADLRAAGLTVAASTYAPDAERYLVTTRRSGAGAGAG
jgi:SAM-dependent methyltransferase